ncbi:MAG: WecB/TagA/CpsF family glycosyltransferase [bacterium]|jgi:N-acetylglucosaminyldiphosphoundecaprenol N-acetyl-beta-D-mannosaminyltransferase
MSRSEVLGIPLDKVTLKEARQQLAIWLQEDKTRLVFTPNAEIIALAQDNPELKKALITADLTVPDGIGVVWAARWLQSPLPERVPGIDLLQELMELAAEKGYSVYFLGSSPGVANEAARRLKKQHAGLYVIGTHHGYFSAEQEKDIISQIQEHRPDILVVALGAPKQELWLVKHRRQLPVKIAIGVGGSLDVLAGQVKRAPAFWQRLGLEWLYRILTQPKRLKRAWQLPRFVWMVLSPKSRHDNT